VQAAGHLTLAAYATFLQQTAPPLLAETPSGPRITQGSLVLNDGERAEAFLGILSVGEASG
jgi:hypothetical protein